MSKITAIIVDDEELARELIATHVQQLPDFEIVALCASAIEASSILKKERVDLLFLDIEMPVLKGTEFLKNLANKPKVILADEPTGSLDKKNADEIFGLLKKQITPNRLILFATHNRFLANKSDCLLEMVDGRLKSINARI